MMPCIDQLLGGSDSVRQVRGIAKIVSRGRRARTRSAVSVVEVVVISSALGLLMLAWTPLLASVRVSSKERRCLANLMEIGFANAVYASTELSDPALPVHALQFRQPPEGPTFIGAYEWGGKSGLGRPGYREFPSMLGSKYGSGIGFGPATRPLNTVLYKDALANAWNDGTLDREQAERGTQLELAEARCPADTGYSGIHFPAFREDKLSSYDHFGTSYTANMFMISSTGYEMWSYSPYLHRLSEVQSPAKTLAYYENNGRFAWSARPMPRDCVWMGPNKEGTIVGWHGTKWVFNAAFIDGHADPIFMRSFQNPDVMEDARLQQSYRCIIIRGEDWIKDALPLDRAFGGAFTEYVGGASWEDGIW